MNTENINLQARRRLRDPNMRWGGPSEAVRHYAYMVAQDVAAGRDPEPCFVRAFVVADRLWRVQSLAYVSATADG